MRSPSPRRTASGDPHGSRWGRLLLAAYAAAMTLTLWPLAFLGRPTGEVAEVAAAPAAGGLALFLVVAWRDAAVGRARRWRATGASYLASLLLVAFSAFFLRAIAGNLAATAEVRHCKVSHTRTGRTTSCYGRWTVNGRTYSGFLPGVHGETSPAAIRFDPDDPARLGGNSYAVSVTAFLLTSLFALAFTPGWAAAVRRKR